MSSPNVELAKRAYAALNDAYKSGDLEPYRAFLDETLAAGAVFRTSGRLLPEAGEWRGPEGILRFIEAQMEAFREMRIEPQEYVDMGDRVIVPVQLGGKARHTGIDIEFSVVHAFAFENGKATSLEVYLTKEEALEAVRLSKPYPPG